MAARRRRQAGVLGIAVCVAGGCVAGRVTAVDQIAGGTDAGDTGSEVYPDGAADALGDGAMGPSEDGPDGGPAPERCTNPVFVTSQPYGIFNNGGYFVFNNMWNAAAGPGPQTLYACSYHSWYVVSDQADDAGAVETYPNVQMNFNDVPLSSFAGITATFAETSPRVGIYEEAFDVWLDGVAQPESIQVMVWVDVFNRTPLGSQVTTTTLAGRTYGVWKTSDGLQITLVSTETFTAGTVDLLGIFDWTMAQGLVPHAATLGQIDFGVEIVSTGGASATYEFNDFSIDTH
jgi:hypothetical protein